MVAALKPALHLLQLIESRNYSDAVKFVERNSGEDNHLEQLSPDLIYKVAYSFGNENNNQLNLLLVVLFRLLESKTEKCRLCCELLSWRTSPFLTEILLYQLESLLRADFQVEHSDLCEQICGELPKRLERRLCERLMSEDENLEYAITEAAHVLKFYDRIPLKTTFSFDQLIGEVLSKIQFDEPAAFPFLIWYARKHPFSPRLLGLTEPTVLIPNVYDRNYLQLRLTEGICEYISGDEQRYV
ncbi:hypothetical protein COOONC_12757 [Cooperia oncophora]